MTVEKRIEAYIGSQPEPKRSELRELHGIMLRLMPEGPLWFLDGKDDDNKTVSNPNIGYGNHTIHYADGKTREFYKVGLSANTAGISVYIFGIDDKTHLPRTLGKTLGKARVSGYCIKFRSLKDINLDVLEEAIRKEIEN